MKTCIIWDFTRDFFDFKLNHNSSMKGNFLMFWIFLGGGSDLQCFSLITLSDCKTAFLNLWWLVISVFFFLKKAAFWILVSTMQLRNLQLLLCLPLARSSISVIAPACRWAGRDSGPAAKAKIIFFNSAPVSDAASGGGSMSCLTQLITARPGCLRELIVTWVRKWSVPARQIGATRRQRGFCHQL